MSVDPLDVSLEDADLNEEIGLLTDLIVLAAESELPLTRDTIDAALRLR